VKPRGLVVGAVQLCTWCAVRGPATRARLLNRLLLSLTPSALCPRNKRYYLPVPVHARAVTLVVVSRVARHGSCYGVSVHTRALSAWSGSTSSCTSAVVFLSWCYAWQRLKRVRFNPPWPGGRRSGKQAME